MENLCPLCNLLQLENLNTNSLLIHEFPCSYLFFGQHQFYAGYCVLVSKVHARELHHLSSECRDGLWQELISSGRAIEKVFNPWKLNVACYGNQVEHIHWHIFPRYLNDPKHLECPFSNSQQFKDYPSDSDALQIKRALLREEFEE